MERNILPEGWIEDSIENFLYHRTTKSQIIYIVVILSVAIGICLLPFIYIDISAEGIGIVRPQTERSSIISPVTEIVDKVFIAEGDTVRKGEPILRFRTKNDDAKISYQQEQISETKKQYHDLQYLAKAQKPINFESPQRAQEYQDFQTRKAQIQASIQQCKTEWLRNKALYDEKLISEEEYNKYLYQYEDKEKEYEVLVQNQLTTWQTDKKNIEKQSLQASSELKQNQTNRDLTVVRSPVDGTIEQFQGIYQGMTITSGTQIAVVSPNTKLNIEAHVSPKDIALITTGMPVKIQMESFNYNEWGTLKGYVTSISSDYVQDNSSNVYYKVKIQLDKDYLRLKKTGRIGKIKKGMTVVAHFMISRKSLFELLYKSIDDMVNPTQYKKLKNTTEQ